MSLQVELLEQSFNYIKPYGNLFVSSFYENLLNNNSEIKFLIIGIEPENLKNQFWDSLVLVMENLRQPDVLKNVLKGLGARLFTDGVLAKHYPLARNAFLTTFEQFLGSEWTAEFEQAWKDAYVYFRELMLDGAEQTHQQIARKTPATKLEETWDISTKDLSESLKLETIDDRQFTQTLSSQSQSTSTSTATATKVKSVASAKTYEPESQSPKLNKKLLIASGIAGVIGILLLLILL